MTIKLSINGRMRDIRAAAGETLLEVLRREGFVGVKSGCERGDCGACAVLMNGRAVNACLVLAARADGAEIVTVEGLADEAGLHPLQEAFLEEGAVQCGYCTPGMLISAADLLARNSTPTRDDIKHAISGNLCRCTGYAKQIRAIERAAERMRSAADA